MKLKKGSPDLVSLKCSCLIGEMKINGIVCQLQIKGEGANFIMEWSQKGEVATSHERGEEFHMEGPFLFPAEPEAGDSGGGGGTNFRLKDGT